MSERIRKVYKANPTLKSGAIAAMVGTNPAYVYNVLWHHRRKKEQRQQVVKLKPREIRAEQEDPIKLTSFSQLLRERLAKSEAADAPVQKSLAEMIAEWPDDEEPAKAPAQEANTVQVGGDHYKSKAIQPWDYIAANGLGYFEGNVVKYVTRYKEKGGVADLEKAKHYLEKLIEQERG
jgi:hypothetical protein